MERELWPVSYRSLREVGRDFRPKYVQHQPWALAAVLFGAALMRMPLPAGQGPGSGKHSQGPHRRRSLALIRPAFGRALYRERTRIERPFGNATSFAGGLGPVPAWVRGRARVPTWVWAKLLINGVRILRKNELR